jgi:hypothetical protein
MNKIFTFLEHYLDPSDRLGEVLFGLIMVLVTTVGARSIVTEGHDATRDMLVAMVGCNVGWGIISGGLFVTHAMFERGRVARLVRDVQQQTDEERALAVIADELDPDLKEVASEDVRAHLYRDILGNVRKIDPPKTRLLRADLYGAFAVFWLVTLTAIPAIVPFLFFEKLRLALRVANLLLVAMLFLVGFRWAGITNTNRWVAGLLMMFVGLAMVIVAELLGG